MRPEGKKSAPFLRFTPAFIFLLGLLLNAYFEVRAGHHFTFLFVLFLPAICLPYVLPALASLLARKTFPLVILTVTQLALLAFDLFYARSWSSPLEDAILGNAFVLMAQIGVSLVLSTVAIALNGSL